MLYVTPPDSGWLFSFRQEPVEPDFFYFLTDYLSHVLLSEYSDTFGKYDKRLL